MKKFKLFLATLTLSTVFAPAALAEDRTPFESRAIHRGSYGDIELGLRLSDGTGIKEGKGAQIGFSGETSVAPFVRQKVELSLGGETNDHLVGGARFQTFANKDVGFIFDTNLKRGPRNMTGNMGIGVRVRNEGETIHGNTSLIVDAVNYNEDLQTQLKGFSLGGVRLLSEQNISDVLSIQAAAGATAVYGMKRNQELDPATMTMKGVQSKQGEMSWLYSASLAAKARLGENAYVKAEGSIEKLAYAFTEKDKDLVDLPTQEAESSVKTVMVSVGYAF
ncbi:hypothetical protein WDW86_21875 [Bdellovibrionota bacterium FG-2]